MDQHFWMSVIRLTFINMKRFALVQIKTFGFVLITISVALYLLGYPSALLIALFISLVDLLPIFGSGIVFIPWIIFEWVGENPEQGWWLLAIYIGVFLLKLILEPLILGNAMNLPFWIPFVVFIVCSILFNVFGVVATTTAVPFISAFRTVKNTQNLESDS